MKSQPPYYAFGMEMPGRAVGQDYKYGNNGKMKDNEMYEGSQDFGARMYDNRLGRFMSQDPDGKNYPMWSPYNYANNSPMAFNDDEGLNPRLRITIKADGSVVVQITNAILLYGKSGNLVAAKSYLSNYQNFFDKGANVSVAWGSGITNVTFEVTTELYEYATEADAIAARQNRGFGVITQYLPGEGDSFYKDNKLKIYRTNKAQFKRDPEHELGHDWGMADIYVNLENADGTVSHGYKVVLPTTTPTCDEKSVIIVADLMNDAFSPLSNETWKEIATQILDDYGCLGPGTYQVDVAPMHIDLEYQKAAMKGGDFSAGVHVQYKGGVHLELKKGADIYRGSIKKNPSGTNSLNRTGNSTRSRKSNTVYQNTRSLD